MPKKKGAKDMEENLELSEEQFDELVEGLENFQDSFLSYLAGTSKFEIIPTINEEGEIYPETQLDMIRRECKRLNIRTIYSISYPNHTLLIDPDSMKLCYVPDDRMFH